MIAIFTPTRLWGGLDVTYSGLLRQNREDLLWLIADEYFWERRDTVERLNLEAPFNIFHFSVHKFEGAVRNLAAAYNAGLELSRSTGCDLFISLQDYIWIPDDGVERFERMADALPDQLLTGLTSIAADPPKEKVVDREGHYTIFAEPYTDKPQEIDWVDVRQYHQPDGYMRRNPIEWETNWAAVPKVVLENREILFDEELDRGGGIAYENQAYAYKAEDFGCGVWIDMDNHAISLPHKKYYKEIEDFEAPLADINRKLVEERYGWG